MLDKWQVIDPPGSRHAAANSRSSFDSPTFPLFHSEYLHDHPLPALPIEFGVKHPLPRSQIQSPVRDWQRRLMVQQQRLQMCVSIILAGLMVFVIRPRRRQFFQPLANILNQSALVIVHIHGSSNVHRRHKAQAVIDPAAPYNLLYLIRNMNHLPPFPGFKNQVLCVALHSTSHAQPPLTDVSRDSAILITAVTASNTPAEALSQRGLDLLAAGDPTQAALAFRAAIAAAHEENAIQSEAHHGLIRALRDAGQLNESVGAAMALIALTPSDPLAHTALSISLQAAGHIPEAEAAAARARVLEWKIQLNTPFAADPIL